MKTDENRQSLRIATKTLRNMFGGPVAKAKYDAQDRWSKIVEGEEPDWLWNAVVQSFATNGGARHLIHLTFIREQFKASSGRDPLSWQSVIDYDEKRLLEWLAIAANPHFQRWGKLRNRLKEFVDANRDKLAEVSAHLLTTDRAACLEALIKIPGFSDKYARNLMMDVGHPAFMDDCFALDSRLADFLEAFTDTGHTYSGRSKAKWTEADLLDVAHSVGLSAWEMDRLIFSHWAKFIGPWQIPFKGRKLKIPKVKLSIAA